MSGLIPARAGPTRSVSAEWTEPRAHPRSRGAHGDSGPKRLATPGSSPLARGARRNHQRRPHARGLIPARAGRTVAWVQRASPARAHPRSRGADVVCRRSDRGQGGSSPLARGARESIAGADADHWLIPARAGRTPMPNQRRKRPRAHPRSRGAHRTYVSLDLVRYGSSPLARGALQALRRPGGQDGLIPARAGRTPPRQRDARPYPAHPRSRGAHPPRPGPAGGPDGSSPLARGARSGCARSARTTGLIPARAGRTSATPRCTWG